ncbi:hypothetical protein BCR34DRAFT_561892 [Clohesyomyces aquaticus]|uniref:Prion-inhibition and propagation-domain-containing protein n=1 Tax=Clohesyomyces aquaticus TaxID=1231657 RepID=A0A1Y1ZTC5_9PLEO|nr:hypothetical protein BCR34DRAFT_561892 [Clohesyomyces aquaticus]
MYSLEIPCISSTSISEVETSLRASSTTMPPTGSAQAPPNPLESFANKSSVWSTITGTVSFVNDVLDLVNKANRSINEFQRFDQDSASLLITFSREIALLEVWSQSLGFELESNGQFKKVDVTAFASRSPTRARQLDALKLIFDAIVGLLNKLVLAFEAIGNPTLEKVVKFLNQLNIPHPESGSARTLDASATSLEVRLRQELESAGLIDKAGPHWSNKLLQIASEKQPQIVEMLQELSRQNGILSTCVIERKLDMLESVPACLAGVTDIKDKQTEIGKDVKTIQTKVSRLQLISKYEVLRKSASSDNDALPRAAKRVIYALQGDFEIADDEDVEMEISKDELVFVKDSAFAQKRQVVLYNGAQHLVDWNEDIVADSDDEKSEVSNRLGKLTRALRLDPTGLRILPTTGYVSALDDTESKYGLIYLLPQDYDIDPRSLGIKTLKELFATTSKCACYCSHCRICQVSRSTPAIRMPTLDERLQLVVSLLKAFREFQASQWLHQGISSENIVFVCSGTPGYLEEPWIMGFDFARPVGSGSDRRKIGAFSDYQHPLRRQQKDDGRSHQRYRAEFELYSIGRLMVEIACWEEVKEELLDGAIGYLPDIVGKLFIDAAKWCLGMSDDSPMKVGNIKSNAPPTVGAWSGNLIRLFEFNVLWKVLDCQAS